MEITCNRCHQTVQADSCYCPACGLPQLVYATDGDAVPARLERWPEPVRDASSIDWKPAMRAALCGRSGRTALSSGFSVQLIRIVLDGGSRGWAVVLYMRSQRPAWITIGAGARIGLVTGLSPHGWPSASAAAGCS